MESENLLHMIQQQNRLPFFVRQTVLLIADYFILSTAQIRYPG